MLLISKTTDKSVTFSRSETGASLSGVSHLLLLLYLCWRLSGSKTVQHILQRVPRLL